MLSRFSQRRKKRWTRTTRASFASRSSRKNCDTEYYVVRLTRLLQLKAMHMTWGSISFLHESVKWGALNSAHEAQAISVAMPSARRR